MLSDAHGERLVRLARTAVERYVRESVIVKPEKGESPMSGVFVTLNYLKGKEEHLRGCIGFALPRKQLHQSVIDAAIAAATEDPRFAPVNSKELGNIIFEVSVLAEPEELKPDYKKQIRIGRDGLLLRWEYGSGLLLPQVPVELGWDVDEYLANICYKASAPADVWQDPSSKLYSFRVIVFKELEPGGRVSRLEQYK
ncbi:MAG: TIGR00296 family protein [Nitrososphaera sp.]|uniref:TIGR00296 family protein n=1 Tax=Nitrososphaera sp. TaxID=1971748 RepID=UPI003D6DB5BA